MTVNKYGHKCASTSRVLTRNASKGWLADRVASEPRKNPNMGAKELQAKLPDDHNITIGYGGAEREH